MKKLAITMLALVVTFGMGFASEADGHLEDGEYIGYSEADENSFVEAVVNIEDGEITSVELSEYTDLYLEKGEGYPLEWHEAMDVLPERFVEANSSEVDAVSGATGSSEKAKSAVEMALQKARGVEQFDGTFLGRSEESERGNWGVAWVTIEGDEIVDVRLEEATEDEEFKGEDYPWLEFHHAQELVADAFVLFDSPDVDTYSGATSSTELWREAVQNALEKSGWSFE